MSKIKLVGAVEVQGREKAKVLDVELWDPGSGKIVRITFIDEDRLPFYYDAKFTVVSLNTWEKRIGKWFDINHVVEEKKEDAPVS